MIFSQLNVLLLLCEAASDISVMRLGNVQPSPQEKAFLLLWGVFLLSFANLAADTENAGPAQQREPKLHPGFKLFGVFF